MTNAYHIFIERVWPQLPDELNGQIESGYPNVRLSAAPGFSPLAELPVCMLVGLTGTGKSTTVAALDSLRQAGAVDYHDDIPSRRELADWILIPSAQVIAGETIRPVTDRTERFRLTRRFAEEVEAGGSAAVYSWLYYRGSGPLLSEALRGPREIAYALARYPNWHMVELWVDPVLRLQRLSQRKDAFDQVSANGSKLEMDFLTPAQQTRVESLLAADQISPAAVVTARSEAQNYGNQPYDPQNTTPNYRCIIIDGLEPQAIAQQIMSSLQEQA